MKFNENTYIVHATERYYNYGIYQTAKMISWAIE